MPILERFFCCKDLKNAGKFPDYLQTICRHISLQFFLGIPFKNLQQVLGCFAHENLPVKFENSLQTGLQVSRHSAGLDRVKAVMRPFRDDGEGTEQITSPPQCTFIAL